ncbi:MAG: ribose-5-phosphate isomerase RpiA [Hyphomicrobiaceae bacterium]
MTADEMKRRAAEAAIELVTPGMRLGLGTGSTAKHFVDLVGGRVKSGMDVLCVPTSEATRAQAEGLGIPLTTLDETPELDLTVDGADELDGALQLIKGGGGALLREKLVAASSTRLVIIADGSKKVAQLGAFPLPVEIVPFGYRSTLAMIERSAKVAGCTGALTVRLKGDGAIYVTDNGNYICDCAFGQIGNAMLLDQGLRALPGVVETGLFLGMADLALIAGEGGLETIRRTV